MKKTIINLSIVLFGAFLLSFNVNLSLSDNENGLEMTLGVNTADAIDIIIGQGYCVCKETECLSAAWISFRTDCFWWSNNDPNDEECLANYAASGSDKCDAPDPE